MAQAIVQEARARALRIPERLSSDYTIGLGVEARVNGFSLCVGNARLLTSKGIAVTQRSSRDVRRFERQAITPLFVAVDGRLQGVLGYADPLRPEAPEVICTLRRQGIKEIAMLTGDHPHVARQAAQALGITHYVADIFPEEKAEVVRGLQVKGYKVVVVGDGINDAPALAQADVGIAMNGGTDVAQETAHVALRSGGLRQIPLAIDIAQEGVHLIRQNWQLVAMPNTVALGLACLGVLGPKVERHFQSELTPVQVANRKVIKMIGSDIKRMALGLTIAGLGIVLSLSGPARARNANTVTIQSGDVTATQAVVWGRCNREIDAYLVADVATTPDFSNTFEFDDDNDLEAKLGPLVKLVTEATDYTGSIVAPGLQPHTTYYYQLRCVSRPASGVQRADVSPVGTFDTAPAPNRKAAVRFVWAADLAGQGWGRYPELEITTVDGNTVRGGYVIFEVMRTFKPDFAVFQGDMIYADNVIPAEQEIPAEVGGGTWHNSPVKDFVALTLDDFRANWKYNLGDDKLVAFLQHTPVYTQWDDHEVTNNWYPGEILAAEPYHGMNANVLAAHAQRALREYSTIHGDRIYRKVQHGKHLELFFLDERSFRGPNPENSRVKGIEMLGQEQFDWLKRSLKDSTATWKVISTHDPLSIVTGGPGDYDAWSQGEPEVLGREVQLSQLLKFIKDEGIKNVVYLTSDVHFTAAVRYDPAQAVFTDFTPFHEFVIGPIHAGAFGPGELDSSFGASYDYVRGPDNQEPPLPANLPPPNLQSFGVADVSKSGQLTIQLVDITGEILFESIIEPE